MTTLAFAVAATIKHDGRGGVADLLSTPAEATAWLADNLDLVADVLGRPLELPLSGKKSARSDEFLPETQADGRDDVVRRELARIRRAVRALFARAVEPGPPSTADADRLMGFEDALRLVNRAAAQLGTPYLEWVDEPVVRSSYGTDDPVALLVGAVGRSAIDFLAGPDRTRLRACPAARCVKYFLQDDPRQVWCSPACGNRERVNRAYRKRRQQ
ncbi:MAG TPA: ABATE domain-containing protein [Kribbella sp.]